VGLQRGKTVLCIGSDLIHLNLRCSLLKEHGWRVDSAGSGHEGVVRFGRERFDVVILDLNDGGAESALIAGELKRQRPDVAIIILVNANVQTPGATLQADAVVEKSKEAELLHKALRKVLGAG